MADLVLKNAKGLEKTYTGVKTVNFNTTDGGTAVFGSIADEANLKPQFIKNGVNIFGVTGVLDGGAGGGSVVLTNTLPIVWKPNDVAENNPRIEDPDSGEVLMVKVANLLTNTVAGHEPMFTNTMLYVFFGGEVVPVQSPYFVDMSEDDLEAFLVMYGSYSEGIFLYGFMSAGTLEGATVPEPGIYVMDTLTMQLTTEEKDKFAFILAEMPAAATETTE